LSTTIQIQATSAKALGWSPDYKTSPPHRFRWRNSPRRGFDEASEHFHSRALAGSVGTEIAEDLAGADDEADALDDGDVLVTLGQVAHFEHGEFDTGGEGLVPRRVRCTLVAVILTSMRWRQVDFDQKAITIGKAKSVPGTGHVIPMNDELLAEFIPR
jgi:hypothetical protein